MAVNRRSVEFNTCDTAVGANEYSPGGGNAISIINDEGKEIQGTACVVESVRNATLTQAIGEINGLSRTGKFGIWLGSGTWSVVTDLDMITYDGTTQTNFLVPSDYYPSTFGFIPAWCDGTSIEAVGMEMTTGAVPNSAGNNYFYDNVTYIPNGDWPYAINGTSTITDLATAELVTSTGFNQTCLLDKGVFFFYAGIVIGWDGSATPVLTDFTFSESGKSFAIVNVPSLATATATTRAEHSRWTVRMDATNPSFSMTNCTFFSTESDAANRDHDTSLVFTGTNGSASITSSNILDLDQITLTSVVTVSGGRLRAISITQGGAEIKDNAVVATQSAANVATITDPTFGPSSGMHDMSFSQAGLGHAVEITGNISLTNVTFEGYNTSNGQPDSAIFVNTTDPVTISTDSANPTFRTIGTNNVTIVGPDRNLTITGIKDDTEIRITRTSDNTEIGGIETIQTIGTKNDGIGTVTTSGTTDDRTFNFAYQYSADIPVRIAVVSIEFEVIYLSRTLGDSDLTISVSQQPDRNYNNPA